MSQYSLDGNWTMPSVSVPQVRSTNDLLLGVAPTTAAQIWNKSPMAIVANTSPAVATTSTVVDSPSLFGRIGDMFGNGWNTVKGWFSGSDQPAYDLKSLGYTDEMIKNMDASALNQANLIANQRQALDSMNRLGGIGWNLGTAKLGFDILGGIGSWIQGNRNLQFAKDQLDWQKNAWQQQFDLAKEDRDRAIQDRENNRKAFSGM